MMTLIVVELGFSFLHPVPHAVTVQMYFEDDQYTGYRIKPNSVGHYRNHIVAIANENGHRDDFVPVRKPGGTIRILVLGDSFSVGANVEQEDAYPQLLEVLFSEKMIEKVEVVNSSVSSWEPFQYAEYYEHYGHDFSPDLVLVGFFVGNDTYNQIREVGQSRTAVLGRLVSQEASKEFSLYPKVFLYNNSNVARLIMNKAPTRWGRKRENCADFTDWYLAIQKKRLTNHKQRDEKRKTSIKNAIDQVLRISASAGRDSIPLAVILIPDENQINENLRRSILTESDRDKYDFDMPQSLLMEEFSKVGIPTIDLLPRFRSDSRCLYMNDTHWNESGHKLAAKYIFEEILNRSLFPFPVDQTVSRHRSETEPSAIDGFQR